MKFPKWVYFTENKEEDPSVTHFQELHLWKAFPLHGEKKGAFKEDHQA